MNARIAFWLAAIFMLTAFAFGCVLAVAKVFLEGIIEGPSTSLLFLGWGSVIAGECSLRLVKLSMDRVEELLRSS